MLEYAICPSKRHLESLSLSALWLKMSLLSHMSDMASASLIMTSVGMIIRGFSEIEPFTKSSFIFDPHVGLVIMIFNQWYVNIIPENAPAPIWFVFSHTVFRSYYPGFKFAIMRFIITLHFHSFSFSLFLSFISLVASSISSAFLVAIRSITYYILLLPCVCLNCNLCISCIFEGK